MNTLCNGMRAASPGILLGAAICLALLPGLQAQDVSAGITGIVSDPSDAAIAHADVVVEDLDRGVS